jgi:hypothetical protein
MHSLRRKTMSVSPITIVRSALVCNPVGYVVPAEASFSDVLVKVISAPQSVDWAHVYQEEREPPRETTAAQSQSESLAPVTSWSPYSNSATDLYIQLETLLRSKSLLIGIA